MSFLVMPKGDLFPRLPTSSRDQVFARGLVIEDSGNNAQNNAAILAATSGYQAYAQQITSKINHGFNAQQLKDLAQRPCVAVIADGATLHPNTLNQQQRDLQALDKESAFQVGKTLAEKGARVVLPGYLGLCGSVIEGVRAAGGHYIVAATRKSLHFNDDGKPLLPQDDGRGMYIVTNTLGESKSVLFALANSVTYLKGGLNTMDMFACHFVLSQTEMIHGYSTTSPKNRHTILLNEDGFWKPAVKLTKHLIREGFADRTIEKNDFKIIQQAPTVKRLVDLAMVNVDKPEKWNPTLFEKSQQVFIPSQAITLVSNLTRDSVLQQIVPVSQDDLLASLKLARKPLKGGTPVHSALQPFIDQEGVAVYCGSREGINPKHKEAAKATGALLVDLDIPTIYGGSAHGLMGAVADGAIEAAQGKPVNILAVTPFAFLIGKSKAANEGFHAGITATIGVPGMQERKMMMSALSPRAAIMLTGAWGSIDETLEELSVLLKDHDKKKIIIFNVDGHWNGFPKLFKGAIHRGYMSEADLKRIQVVESIPEMRAALLATNSGARPSLVPSPQ